jgi:hypothetical protein
MTEQTDMDAARTMAQAYFDAMLEWEQWSVQVAGDDIDGAQRRTRLAGIFGQYLSSNALQHPQSRLEFLDYGEPPEFGGQIQLAEAAGSDKVWVYVADGVIGGRARYALKREQAGWKVDSAESDVANQGKWKKRPDL